MKFTLKIYHLHITEKWINDYIRKETIIVLYNKNQLHEKTYAVHYLVYEEFPGNSIMQFFSSWRIQSVRFAKDDATQRRLPDETGSSAQGFTWWEMDFVQFIPGGLSQR